MNKASSLPTSSLAVVGICFLDDSRSDWDELESPSSLVYISWWLRMLNTFSNIYRPFAFLPLRAVSSGPHPLSHWMMVWVFNFWSPLLIVDINPVGCITGKYFSAIPQAVHLLC